MESNHASFVTRCVCELQQRCRDSMLMSTSILWLCRSLRIMAPFLDFSAKLATSVSILVVCTSGFNSQASPTVHTASRHGYSCAAAQIRFKCAHEEYNLGNLADGPLRSTHAITSPRLERFLIDTRRRNVRIVLPQCRHWPARILRLGGTATLVAT